MTKNIKDQQQLEAAFEQFNAVSGQLIDSYRQLESQVAVLNAQLDEANNQLRKQRDENAALAERLGMLLETLPAGVVELSATGDILTNNPAARRMLGACHEQQSWQQVLALLTYSKEDDTYGPPGASRDLRLTLQYQPLPASGGQIVLIHDVTRLHQLNSELAQQHKLAAMGSMAASLAHQLRTPLATAMLYTANLKNDIPSAEDRARFVDKSLARMRALETLIQNMLSFVRGQVSTLEPLALNVLLEEITAIMQPQCQGKNVLFVCEPDLAQAVKVLADHKALQGALINLLENAWHFSKAGEVLRLQVQADEHRLIFRVIDQGPGIDLLEKDKLFEPFFTTRPGGTGLGLSIVKKVAEELGGGVRCYNLPAAGACFELSLPLQ
ncbi:ATP-binding protein [Neisseriaceae bacterium TC5R-5]|nr:ATP-binding protein [Neisseriaceae bacterium TC5R-5]